MSKKLSPKSKVVLSEEVNTTQCQFDRTLSCKLSHKEMSGIG